MIENIDKVRKIRVFLLNLLSELTLDQLNKIPVGFNNNIIWNLGHLISTQQRICYQRSGLELIVDEKFFREYETGSKPERDISFEELASIKKLLIDSLDIFEIDYKNGLFETYQPVTTRYAVQLNNVQEAFTFLMFHEGLHFGAITALKRLVV